MDYLDKILILATLLLTAVVGVYRSRQVRSQDQYLLAGRKTGLFALTATLVMTEFNTTALLSFAGTGYSAGLRGMLLPLVILVFLLFYAVTVAKKWKQFNGLSVAHFFTKRYGKDVGLIAAIILFSAMLCFSATYIKSLTLLFSPAFPTLTAWQLSGLLTLLVTIITLRGGLFSIIRVDIFSFIAVAIFFPVLLYFTLQMPEVGESVAVVKTWSLPYEVLPTKLVISLMIILPLSYSLAPWYGQKIVSAKSENTAYLAVILAAILASIFYGMGVYSTHIMAKKGVILQDHQNALPYLINRVMPAGIRGISYTMLFCVAATTMTGIWSAMVTILLGEQRESSKGIQYSIILTLCCAFVSFILSNIFVDQIFAKMVLANVPIVALSFPLLAGFYWKKVSRAGVYSSIITCISTGLACYLYYGEQGNYLWYWALYGISTSYLVGISFSLLMPDNVEYRTSAAVIN